MSIKRKFHVCFNPKPGELAMAGNKVCTVYTGHITTRPCGCPLIWDAMVDGELKKFKHYELKPVNIAEDTYRHETTQ